MAGLNTRRGRMSAMLPRTVATVTLTFSLGSANAQVNPGAPSATTQPTFPGGSGPVIAIDEAHKNTHTFGSPPFRGLVQLLQADGYRVRPMAGIVSDSSLVDVDILLICQPGGWSGPEDSLNEQEVGRVLEWLRAGGSLLLVLDHLPAPRNAARLTRALGITKWENGYTMAASSDSAPIGPIIFWRGGRVAVFGETGLFSGGPAGDNRVFVLNVFHWLSGLPLGVVRPPDVAQLSAAASGRR